MATKCHKGAWVRAAVLVEKVLLAYEDAARRAQVYRTVRGFDDPYLGGKLAGLKVVLDAAGVVLEDRVA